MRTNISWTGRGRFDPVNTFDRALLATFAPTLRQAMPEVLSAYQLQLRMYPLVTRRPANRGAISRLVCAQDDHWMQLFAGRFDEAYLDSVRIIAKIHSDIGLDPAWCISKHGIVLARFHQIASRHAMRGYAPARTRRIARLTRVVTDILLLDAKHVAALYN